MADASCRECCGLRFRFDRRVVPCPCVNLPVAAAEEAALAFWRTAKPLYLDRYGSPAGVCAPDELGFALCDAGGWLEVQRCDDCTVFDDDVGAAEAMKALVHEMAPAHVGSTTVGAPTEPRLVCPGCAYAGDEDAEAAGSRFRHSELVPRWHDVEVDGLVLDDASEAGGGDGADALLECGKCANTLEIPTGFEVSR